MTKLFQRIRRAQLAIAPAAMLAIVLLAVCADPEALTTPPREGEEPTLDGEAIEGFTVLDQDWGAQASRGGGGYWCNTVRCVVEKCPKPQSGGSVVCSCTRVGEPEWSFGPMTHDGHTWGLPDTADEKAWGAYASETQHGGGTGRQGGDRTMGG